MMTLVKFRFAPDKKSTWLDWCEELKRRSDEVYTTLENEGVRLEACFISKKDDSCYYLMAADDVKRALEISQSSTISIDAEHKKVFEESLIFEENLELLFSFEKPKYNV